MVVIFKKYKDPILGMASFVPGMDEFELTVKNARGNYDENMSGLLARKFTVDNPLDCGLSYVWREN